ncbi:MAG: hypothetical protein ACYCTE_14700 [Acidimicrobiales bacterium]
MIVASAQPVPVPLLVLAVVAAGLVVTLPVEQAVGERDRVGTGLLAGGEGELLELGGDAAEVHPSRLGTGAAL